MHSFAFPCSFDGVMKYHTILSGKKAKLEEIQARDTVRKGEGGEKKKDEKPREDLLWNMLIESVNE